MKKTNPRSIPRSQADVNKAYVAGEDFGMEFTINCVLYILKDKHNAPDEDIMQFRDEFMYLMDSIAQKYVSYADIKRALEKEYKLYVSFSGVKK